MSDKNNDVYVEVNDDNIDDDNNDDNNDNNNDNINEKTVVAVLTTSMTIITMMTLIVIKLRWLI